ncbi:hypothetical protein [Kitasatospora sp. NBC_01539]|uniref:hypothetical protein n=1 Tax=Kitasatospora sp. NBC_01539 TaxID=2903577 RepID=UPI0038602570
MSYRRAEEIFEESTRLPANPLARPEQWNELQGFTLHRWRHTALTHDAESGTSTPMLPARSRHASVRSLERYARPGVDAVARHVASQDPTARRRHKTHPGRRICGRVSPSTRGGTSMRVRASAPTVLAVAALLTACGSSSPGTTDAAQDSAKWYSSGANSRITQLVSRTTSVLDDIEAMNAGSSSQAGLLHLSSSCARLAHDVEDAEAYAPVPDSRTQGYWKAALGQLGQGASDCRDAMTEQEDVKSKVNSGASILRLGLENLTAVLRSVGAATASPSR